TGRSMTCESGGDCTSKPERVGMAIWGFWHPGGIAAPLAPEGEGGRTDAQRLTRNWPRIPGPRLPRRLMLAVEVDPRRAAGGLVVHLVRGGRGRPVHRRGGRGRTLRRNVPRGAHALVMEFPLEFEEFVTELALAFEYGVILVDEVLHLLDLVSQACEFVVAIV